MFTRNSKYTQCRQFQEDAKDASVSECTRTLSALEALRNIEHSAGHFDYFTKLKVVFSLLYRTSVVRRKCWDLAPVKGVWPHYGV